MFYYKDLPVELLIRVYEQGVHAFPCDGDNFTVNLEDEE